MIRPLPCAILLVLSLCSPLAAQVDDTHPIQSLQRGIFAVQKGDWKTARFQFESVVELRPDNATALYFLAACEAHDGAHDKALTRLEQAVETGFPQWRALAQDPYFARSREDEAFQTGFRALLTRYENRELGVITGLDFDFVLDDPDGKTIRAGDHRGRVLVVFFMDILEPSTLEAASYFSALHERSDLGVSVVGLARVSAKNAREQNRLIQEYVKLNVLPFPVLVASDKDRARVKPFRKHPTALFIDRTGVPRRIVEGLPEENANGAYASAVRATTADRLKAELKKKKKAEEPR